MRWASEGSVKKNTLFSRSIFFFPWNSGRNSKRLSRKRLKKASYPVEGFSLLLFFLSSVPDAVRFSEMIYYGQTAGARRRPSL